VLDRLQGDEASCEYFVILNSQIFNLIILW